MSVYDNMENKMYDARKLITKVCNHDVGNVERSRNVRKYKNFDMIFNERNG